MSLHKDVTGTDLHEPFIRSESDPGAVGAGKVWLKESTGERKMRNSADDGWIAEPINPATQTALDGKADLVEGKVPAAQLPSYVDDVLEYTTVGDLPALGETGKIYAITTGVDANKTFRWSGSAYVQIKGDLALGETESTAYRGDRGKAAYDHAQVVTGNPHNVTKTEVGLPNVTNDAQAKAADVVTVPTAAKIPQTDANGMLDAFLTHTIEFILADAATTPTTGDGKAWHRVTAYEAGMNLVGGAAHNPTAGTGATTIMLRRDRNGTMADMLSTPITIDSTERDSKDAAPCAVNAANDDLAEGDLIWVDLDAIGTGAKGTTVQAFCRKPLP
jgi:hypothetical protein